MIIYFLCSFSFQHLDASICVAVVYALVHLYNEFLGVVNLILFYMKDSFMNLSS